jgi:hypothetical protein
MFKMKNQSGQILLITLLVLSVALTIALSLIGRSTIDTNISSQVEESSRAFSAAEAGIESALKGIISNIPVTLTGSNTSYSVTKDEIVAQGAASYSVGLAGNGEGKSIWLVGHNSNGTLDFTNKYLPNETVSVCWDRNGGEPAMEITVYYIDTSTGSYRTAKVGYDSFARSYPHPGEVNKFTSPGGGNCNPGGDYIATVDFNDLGITDDDTMILMRLRPVYNAANIWVNPSANLPGLGNDYVSCGASIPEVTRCISATQLYPEPPDVFDYVLYANNGSM